MKVKNSLVSGALLTVAALTLNPAFAADSGGTINFSGSISDTTCTISGGTNGSGSKDFSVNLPPLTIADAGTATGIINKAVSGFKLTFSNCASSSAQDTDTLKVRFTSNSIDSTGNYLVNESVNENDPSKAMNVGFAILDASGANLINLTGPYDTGFVKTDLDSGTKTSEFKVKYYKTNTAAAKAGALHSALVYNISYQ